jgi:isorenieratene synthase
MSLSKPVVIVGGGVAGLVTAVHLAARGVRPLLLEADPQFIGGRLKDGPPVALEHQGQQWSFPAEHGVHGLWSPYVNLTAVLNRHSLLPTLIPAQEETWILGEGKRIRKAHIGRAIRQSWFPAPFHYLSLFFRPSFLKMINWRDIASMFQLMGNLFVAMSIDPQMEPEAVKGMSLADFTRGWSPTLKSLFSGLARSALAAHPEDVPASGFIAFLRFYTLLRRDTWEFTYLPGTGGQAICQPLAETACQLGVEIAMGALAVEIGKQRTVDGAQWQVAFEQDGKMQTVMAEQVVLAVDAPAAQKLLRESPETAELTTTLYFPTGIPTAIIRMWFGRRPKGVSEAGIFTGDFVMDNFFWLDRLQPAYRTWSQATGGSAIEMHIYGPPELLEQPDVWLLTQVAQDVNRAFPELRDHRLHLVLQRNIASHTLFSVGEKGKHLGVTTPWQGLFVCGDWVHHPTPAMYLERAATTGLIAANEIITQRGLEAWPVLPHPAPEPFAGWVSRRWTNLRRRMAARKNIQ